MLLIIQPRLRLCQASLYFPDLMHEKPPGATREGTYYGTLSGGCVPPRLPFSPPSYFQVFPLSQRRPNFPERPPESHWKATTNTRENKRGGWQSGSDGRAIHLASGTERARGDRERERERDAAARKEDQRRYGTFIVERGRGLPLPAGKAWWEEGGCNRSLLFSPSLRKAAKEGKCFLPFALSLLSLPPPKSVFHYVRSYGGRWLWRP